MKEFDLGEGAASIASITDKVRPLAAGMPVSSVHFLGETAVFVGAEESAAMVGADGEMTRIDIHSGAILCATSDGARIVSGGDDGKVVALNANGDVTQLVTDAKRRWIDNVALHPDGAVAWSAGKTAFVRSGKGEEKSFEAPSTVGGLAFAPKGLRVAIAHYNGVTLWFPNMAAKPEFLQWAGSHLAPGRQQAYAHERLSRPRPLDVVERRRQGARDLGRRYRDRLAVRQQGWPDGQGAGDAGAFAGARLGGRVPSEAGHHGRRLQRRHRADDPAGGRRRDTGAPQGQCCDRRARLEHQGRAACLCDRRR
jgi:hypothetical protein